MQLTVSGKRIDVGEALRTHVRSSLEAIVGKYFDRAQEGSVVFSREARLFRADILIHVGRGILLQSHSDADAPYTAFDGATERIGKQLRRYKRRLRAHHKDKSEKEIIAAQQYILAPENGEEEADGSGELPRPVIIAEMTTEVATLTVGEAVMRMDLADLPAVLFRNSGHGGLNMVYRRADGNVGWIDPQGSSASA